MGGLDQIQHISFKAFWGQWAMFPYFVEQDEENMQLPQIVYKKVDM